MINISRLKNFLSVLSPARIWKALFHYEYNTPDERYFVEQAMNRRYEIATNIVLRIGLGYHAVLLVVLWRIGNLKFFQSAVVFHIVCAGMMFPMFFSPKSIKHIVKNVGNKFVLPIALVMPPIFYAGVAFVKGDVYADPRYTLLVNHIYVLGIFVSLIHPGRFAVRFCTFLILAAASFVAFSKHPVGLALSVFSTAAMLLATLVTWLLESQNRAVSLREFQLMVQAAPAKIVRQSVLSQADLVEVFAPKQRHCVCISSDWRGYQALTASMASDKLAEALGAYYDMTDELLAVIFPEGNYYTDWIADELFVVVFAKDSAEEKILINAALKFANDLIVRKQGFVERNNIPIQIDVGVASGVALIGMMGPVGHRKATALGDVPGQARRYQSTGKYLRSRLGDNDRVVFGANSLMEITEPFDVNEVQLEASDMMRDLKDDRVFYLEPGNARASRVA